MLRSIAPTSRTCRSVLRALAASPSFSARLPWRALASSSKEDVPDDASTAKARIDGVSNTLREIDPAQNSLLSPIHIPEDPHAIIRESHPAAAILANSAVVVQRELEMMNLMMGFEQANKYVIHDPQGTHLGFMAEQELGIGNTMGRQFLTTHRPFTTHVFDRNMKEVLRFHRPFTWFSSRIKVFDAAEPSRSALSPSRAISPMSPAALSPDLGGTTNPDLSPLSTSEMRIIGESQRQWAPLRRKYNLFLLRDESPSDESIPGSFDQFAYINEPFLSWDFGLKDANSQPIGSVSRNFRGFGREIFTDTGCYALRMDAAAANSENEATNGAEGDDKALATGDAGLSLDQRAVMLATAVSIDFDYFSPKRRGMFGGMSPFMMGGAVPAEAAAAGEVAAGTGAAATSTVAGGAAGGAVARAGGAGAGGLGEGAIAGAGTMAGYEAMRSGLYGHGQGHEGDGNAVDPGYDPNSQNQGGPGSIQQGQQSQQNDSEQVWGYEEQDPWGEQGQGQGQEQEPEQEFWSDEFGDGPDGGDGGGGDFFF